MARDLIKVRKTMGRPLLHDVDDPLWTARAVILDNLSRHRQTRGFIQLERGHNILCLGQERRHTARIKDRTVGADRIHGMRRIPQQRHAAEGPVREGVTIAHGVFVEFRRGMDDLGGIDGGKLEDPLDVRQEFLKPTEAVTLRFKISDSLTKRPVAGLRDVQVLIFEPPGIWQKRVMAKETGDGVYEVTEAFPHVGLFRVMTQIQSRGMRFADQPFTAVPVMSEAQAGEAKSEEGVKK